MTVDEFKSFLGEYAERLEDIGADLTPLVNEMVNDLKGRAPRDTGALKRSIVGAVRGNEVEFGWLNYGSFQNYGVSGKPDDGLGKTVNEAVSPFPRNSKFYQFKKRRFGLPAQNWFNVEEMTRDILDEITRLTNNNQE